MDYDGESSLKKNNNNKTNNSFSTSNEKYLPYCYSGLYGTRLRDKTFPWHLNEYFFVTYN